MLKRFLSLSVFLLVCLCVLRAQSVVIDSNVYLEYQRRLAEAPFPADSLGIATTIFDLGFNDQAVKYGEMAYWLTQELGDNDKAADLIKMLTDCYRNDPAMLDDLIRRAGTLPNGNDKIELMTYLSLCKSFFEANNKSDAHRSQRMKELSGIYMTAPSGGGQYEKIQRLFELCIYQQALLEQSVLLSNYYLTLGEMIEQLPITQTSLRSLYYTLASDTYSKQLMQEKAVEMYMRKLDNIKQMQSYYLSKGRPYRNFDSDRYDILTHILLNYDHLTEAEADSCYRVIGDIAARNVRVAERMERSELPQTFYYMAKGEYSKALPLLKKHFGEITGEDAVYYYKAMVRAADAAGDAAAYKSATKEYIDLLEQYINNRTAHSLTELAMNYDLNDARAEAEARMNERQQSAILSSRHRMVYALAAAVLLLILMLVFMYQWSRKRKSSLELKATVEELKQERDNLQRMQSELILARDQAKAADRQKTDFIHMISHQVKTPLQAISEYSGLIVDCMDDVRKKYLSRYAEVVQLNTELINTMINDITEVSALEAKEVEVKIRPADLHDICTMAVDSVRPTLNPNQKLELDDAGSCLIATDRRRLEQIISNLLENAVKFSEQGVIKVSYRCDPAVSLVEISISDHGPGIPAEKQEAIFERFVKLDNSSAGMGLGLYVTRLLARLMGGDVYVDRSYRGGARFVVTLHTKLL